MRSFLAGCWGGTLLWVAGCGVAGCGVAGCGLVLDGPRDVPTSADGGMDASAAHDGGETPVDAGSNVGEDAVAVAEDAVFPDDAVPVLDDAPLWPDDAPLWPYDAMAFPLDTGVTGARDAGCRGDSDCPDDGYDCTVARCQLGACAQVPDDTRCRVESCGTAACRPSAATSETGCVFAPTPADCAPMLGGSGTVRHCNVPTCIDGLCMSSVVDVPCPTTSCPLACTWASGAIACTTTGTRCSRLLEACVEPSDCVAGLTCAHPTACRTGLCALACAPGTSCTVDVGGTLVTTTCSPAGTCLPPTLPPWCAIAAP